MKKPYSKPQILFESFSLSSSIAGDCEVKTDTQAAGTCGVSFGTITIFVGSAEGCAYKVGVDDGDYNGLCYHIPLDVYNLFNS